MEKIERKSMAKYIVNYLNYVDKNIDKADDKFISDHLIKIGFFQHERMIHLIVTVTSVILNLFAFFLGSLFSNIFVIIFGYMVMCFTIPYIYHYFLLENGVQKMYRQYDKMKNK
jgi:hypothetical protein